MTATRTILLALACLAAACSVPPEIRTPERDEIDLGPGNPKTRGKAG
jgi:hypothetical protein